MDSPPDGRKTADFGRFAVHSYPSSPQVGAARAFPHALFFSDPGAIFFSIPLYRSCAAANVECSAAVLTRRARFAAPIIFQMRRFAGFRTALRFVLFALPPHLSARGMLLSCFAAVALSTVRISLFRCARRVSAAAFPPDPCPAAYAACIYGALFLCRARGAYDPPRRRLFPARPCLWTQPYGAMPVAARHPAAPLPFTGLLDPCTFKTHAAVFVFARRVVYKKGQTERSVWPAVCAICIHSKSKALYHRA